MHIRQHVCHMWMLAPSGAWQITDNSSNKVQFWQFISWPIANKKQQQQRGRCQECHNSTHKFNGTPKSKHPLKSKPPKMLWLHPGLWKYDKQNSEGGDARNVLVLPNTSCSFSFDGFDRDLFLFLSMAALISTTWCQLQPSEFFSYFHNQGFSCNILGALVSVGV